MRTRVFAFVVMFATLGLVPCTAAELPDSATIRAQNAQAVGPLPTAYRETIAFTSTANVGTETIVRRGPDYRDITTTKFDTTARGMYKGDQWMQNDNGHTVIIEPDPQLATAETQTTSVEHVSTPIDAFVITTRNARGGGTREFFDPTTWLLVRRETFSPVGTSVATYDSFQTYGLRRMATHWHVADDSRKVVSDYRVTTFSTDPIAESDVAILNNRGRLVDFPAHTTRVKLPATFVPNGHVIVPVKMGDRSYDFVLDTGAYGISIDPGVIARLGLSIVDRSSNPANAGRIDTGTVIVPEMHVGDLSMHEVHAHAVPFNSVETDGIESVGLLGFDFICELGITIDYQHKTVTAERYGSYDAPPGAIALPIRLGTLTPLATVKINGAVAERMTVDTGATRALIFDYFARRHPEALVDHDGIGARSRPAVFTGVGGRVGTKPYAIENFVFGNFIFRDFVEYVVTSTSYGGAYDGLLGADFLRYFDVHLDYPNGMIYLVPNQRAHDGG